jgi:hypothetical protein
VGVRKGAFCPYMIVMGQFFCFCGRMKKIFIFFCLSKDLDGLDFLKCTGKSGKT